MFPKKNTLEVHTPPQSVILGTNPLAEHLVAAAGLAYGFMRQHNATERLYVAPQTPKSLQERMNSQEKRPNFLHPRTGPIQFALSWLSVGPQLALQLALSWLSVFYTVSSIW